MNSYIVKELKNGRYVLCKVLNEYDNKKEADEDLINIATSNITEKKLLEEYNNKKR